MPAGVTLLSQDGQRSLMRVPDLESLSELMAIVRESGATVSSVWPKRKTLEDLFLREIRDHERDGERS